MRKLAVFVIVAMVAGGAAAYVFYGRLTQPFRGYSSAEQYVEIPQGLGSRAIGSRLSTGNRRRATRHRCVSVRAIVASRLFEDLTPRPAHHDQTVGLA